MTCDRCQRDVAKRTLAETRNGMQCKRCTDRMPPHLRHPRPAKRKDTPA